MDQSARQPPTGLEVRSHLGLPPRSSSSSSSTSLRARGSGTARGGARPPGAQAVRANRGHQRHACSSGLRAGRAARSGARKEAGLGGSERAPAAYRPGSPVPPRRRFAYEGGRRRCFMLVARQRARIEDALNTWLPASWGRRHRPLVVQSALLDELFEFGSVPFRTKAVQHVGNVPQMLGRTTFAKELNGGHAAGHPVPQTHQRPWSHAGLKSSPGKAFAIRDARVIRGSHSGF